jgi:signal transduction histidine kinase
MLFRKYQQIQKNMSDTKGTGLGLVIAQRIASLLDTSIQIESPWRKPSSSMKWTGRREGENDPADSEATPVTMKEAEEGGEGWDEGGEKGGGGTRFFFTVANCAGRGRDATSTPNTASRALALEGVAAMRVLRTSLKVSRHAS